MTPFLSIFILLFTSTICIPFLALSADNTELTISHSSSMPPLSFIDNEGNPKGIIIDFWNLWSEKTGVEVKFKLTDWKDSILSVEKGETDVHGGLFFTENRAEKLEFTTSFFEMNGGIFISKDIAWFKIKDLKTRADLNCGVIKSDYAKHFIEESYPYLSLVLYDSSAEMLKDAAQGKLKIFATDFAVATYHLGVLEAKDSFDYYNLYKNTLRPAVSKKHLDKYSQISSGMNSISPARRTVILTKWLNIEAPSPKWITTVAVLLVALTLCILIFLYKSGIIKMLRSKKSR